MESFFAELEERLETARRQDVDRYQRFFEQLNPQLDAARKLERELNRHLAHRFNVLEYLRTDELGLSRIIADLLDSRRANHGQGALFFRALFEKLKIRGAWPSGFLLDESSISVCVELVTTEKRRIDIAVRFAETHGKSYCIAIENKPYADDQAAQIKDYLKYLDRKYEGRFLLIYSPPSSQGPSSKSIEKVELDNEWKRHFRILPYSRAAEDPRDGFEDYRIRNYSLEEWFADCRRLCDVDRLRWFLGDAESFCRGKFGGHAMTTDSETRAIQQYVLSNADHLATAQAVYDAWPAIKERICERFLELLCGRIKREVTGKLTDFAHDIRVYFKCRFGPRTERGLWLYRTSWTEVEEGHHSKMRRASVRLCIPLSEPHTAWLGVESPHWDKQNTNAADEPRSRMNADLADKLGRAEQERFYPWWKHAEKHNRDWNDLLLKLHQECEVNGGEITDYYVDAFVAIAEVALPIINNIEGDTS